MEPNPAPDVVRIVDATVSDRIQHSSWGRYRSRCETGSRGRSWGRTDPASPPCWIWPAASGIPRRGSSSSSGGAWARSTSARRARGSGSSDITSPRPSPGTSRRATWCSPASAPRSSRGCRRSLRTTAGGRRICSNAWGAPIWRDDRSRPAARANGNASCWRGRCSAVRSSCLLDEPAAGLDLPGRELLLEALSSTADASPTTMLVTHHVEEIPRTATHAALLRRGSLVASGPIQDVLTDADMTACFDLPGIGLVTRRTMAGVGALMPDGAEP